MALYDNKPSMYEANNDGSYTYRWNIQETHIFTEMSDNEATTTKWQCNEVVVWGTVTKDKLTEKVITTMWANDYEKKLINDYNAAKEGVFGSVTEDEAKAHIARYTDFLVRRKVLKDKIVSDCVALAIK